MNNFELAKTLFLSGLNSFQRGDYLKAEDNFRESLKNLPDRISTMTNLAGTLIKLNKLDEAKELCQQAISIEESSAEAWLNLGLIEREESDLSAAAESFKRAIDINPEYAEAHQNLKQVLSNMSHNDFESAERVFLSGLNSFEKGDYPTAEKCFRESLEKMPNEASILTNLSATLIKLNKFDEAREFCLKAISIDEGSAKSWLTLGLVDKELSDFSSAAENIKRAIEKDPDYSEAYNIFGLILNEQSDYAGAVEKFRYAIDLNPDYADAYNNLGLALQNLEQYDDASASFRQALSLNPDSAGVHRNIGVVMILLGKIDEAKSWLVKAIELAPDDVSVLSTALYHLPSLVDDLSPDQLEAVYAERESLPLKERISLGFAMGRVMEHVGRYDDSFSAYADGNRLFKQSHPYDEVKADKTLEMLRRLYSGDLLKKYASVADLVPEYQDERIPIFIIGMPRSGSTLIEQIISSHHEVYGAGELYIMGEFTKEADRLLGSQDYKDTLSSIRALGHRYLDRVWELAPDVRFITDKMLTNYENIGLIHLMLPHAKIIHATRDPMDICFSCYGIKFTEGHEFSYDLETLGRQYLRYQTLMEHWRSVLPQERILDVSYENIVADTENEVRRLLEYLELPWDTACLSFYENTRAVKTASVSQVRKPIYTSSMARWKRFQNHLTPLMEIIMPEKSGGIH
jgi:tetratricopeptide (TPR) repeat protein